MRSRVPRIKLTMSFYQVFLGVTLRHASALKSRSFYHTDANCSWENPVVQTTLLQNINTNIHIPASSVDISSFILVSVGMVNFLLLKETSSAVFIYGT